MAHGLTDNLHNTDTSWQ